VLPRLLPSILDWQYAGLLFSVYLFVVAALRGGMTRRSRLRAIGGAVAGAASVAVSIALSPDGLANLLVAPGVTLFIGYWTSGLLFVAPMPRVERLLVRTDAALRIDAIAAGCPHPVAEFLELAYTGIYPLIPIALWLALHQGVSADRFWTTILVTDFVCFGMLPWIQTRPPRALGFEARWRSRWRTVNLLMLDAGSVQVNTFPSGHAAEALACALLLTDGPAPVVAWMLFNAAAISAGAVFGRYHYAADAFAGWAVAVLVYLAWT
jgi:hypothetical protein